MGFGQNQIVGRRKISAAVLHNRKLMLYVSHGLDQVGGLPTAGPEQRSALRRFPSGLRREEVFYLNRP
jgi:hypothetical protein